MIIYDFYVISISIDPLKANPPLVIDPNAILPRSITAKLLKPVRRRNTKVIQYVGIVEHTQFTITGLLDVLGQLVRTQACEDAGSFFALEGFDRVIRGII